MDNKGIISLFYIQWNRKWLMSHYCQTILYTHSVGKDKGKKLASELVIQTRQF